MLVASATPFAFAQRSLELTPFVAGRFGGTIRADSTDPSPLRVGAGAAGGAALAWNTGTPLSLEFLWTTHSTTGRPPAGQRVHIGLNDCNVTYNVPQREAGIQPYVMGGIGPARLSVAGKAGTKLSLSFGAGLKYFFTPRMGLRLQSRIAMLTLYSGPESELVCDQYAGCYTIEESHGLSQGEVSVGWIFRWQGLYAISWSGMPSRRPMRGRRRLGGHRPKARWAVPVETSSIRLRHVPPRGNRCSTADPQIAVQAYMVAASSQGALASLPRARLPAGAAGSRRLPACAWRCTCPQSGRVVLLRREQFGWIREVLARHLVDRATWNRAGDAERAQPEAPQGLV